MVIKASDSSPSSKKRGEAKRGTPHDRGLVLHRDTGVAPPTFNAIPSHGRIGRGYFDRTYSDVIAHCNKLSSYDE